MKTTISTAVAATLLMTGAALAQSTTPPAGTTETRPGVEVTPPLEAAPPAATNPSATAPAEIVRPADSAAAPGSGPVLTDAQAKAWVNKVVYSSDDKNLGEVADFVRDADGKVREMHADIGGFLGVGEQRVKLMPSDFRLAGDKVVLTLTADQAKTLPKLTKS